MSVGFVALDPDQLSGALASVAGPEAERHDAIDPVIESTELGAMYDLRSEHDLSGTPVSVELGSPESMLHVLQTR